MPANSTLRSSLLTLALPLALTALAAPALAATATRTVEHAIPAAGKVRVANLAGTIDLVPSAEGPVKVVAVVHAEGDSASETRRLLDGMRWVQEHDGTWNLSYPVEDYDAFTYLDNLHSFGGSSNVRFRGERVRVYGRPKMLSSRGAPVLFADITVSVPRGVDLTFKNAVGPVRGRELSAASLTVDTGSGNVKLDGVAGLLLVDTGSGDVALSRLAGSRVMIDTGSGDVDVTDVTAEKLNVDTGSGDVRVVRGKVADLLADTGSGNIEVEHVELLSFSGDTGSGDVSVIGGLARASSVTVDTGSGAVHLLGGDGFEFELTTDVGSGDVRVDFADAEIYRSRREITGARRGSGRTRVVVGTGSGDVVVGPIGGG